MREDAACPPPGIYENVPADVYHAWPAASNSALTVLYDKSPRHLRAELVHPRAETDAMREGTALHVAVLEPQSFPLQYVRSEKFDRRTKAGKEGWAAFCAAHPGKIALEADDFDRITAMRDEVLSHPVASRLLSLATERELSLVWDEDPDAWENGTTPANAVRCKARIDADTGESHGMLLDLKRCEDASPSAMRYTIRTRGYHRQGAKYLRGSSAHGRVRDAFVLIVVEPKYPHDVNTRFLGEDSLRLGARQCQRLLREYRDCLTSGQWPGYSTELAQIDVPAFAFTDEDYR
jgi:hypothetical protein